MENLPLIIYLMEVLPNVGGAFVGAGVNFLFVSLMAFFLSDESDWKRISKVIIKLGVCGILCVFMAAIIPSKDGMYRILAAYGVAEASQSEDVRRISGKSLQLIESTIDGYLEGGDTDG